MSDANTVAAAKSWIDGLNSGLGVHGAWKLQRLERRTKFRTGSSGGQSSSGLAATELPTRLRRFAKGIPWALVPDAIAYLHSLIPYTGIVVNGVNSDERYVPTRTWWERDEGAVVDRGQMTEGTYTLYQDLVDKDHADDITFEAGGSCSEKIVARWVYDAFTVEDVPQGGVGETVSVQAVSRSEDGTFNYAVIVRKAVTKYAGEHITKDDAFERVTLQIWDNLYYDGDVYRDDNGEIVEVPSPSNSGGGTLIEVTPRQNDDCTFQVTAQTTVSKQLVSSRSSSATIFDRTAGAVRRVEDSSEYSEVTEASAGHIRSVKVERRPDGKVDLTEESKVEQSVDDAVIEVRRTLRSVRVARTDRNQEPLTIEQAKERITKVGQSIRVEKTDGGLANITFESVDSSSVGDLREECQKTQFVHTHTKTHNQKADPGDIDAAEASGGHVRTRSKTRTEDGTFDVTSESRVEQSVDDAVIEVRRTLRSVRVARTDRNQEPLTIEQAKAKITKVGQSIRVEKTDGGLANITFESVDSSSVGDLREECQKTVFVHKHSKTRNTKNAPSAAVGAASGGLVKTVSIARTDDGTFDVTSESQSELSYPRSHRSVQRNPFKTVVVYKDTTATTVAQANESLAGSLTQLSYQEDPGSPVVDGVPSRKVQQEFEVSPGGLASQTKTFSFVKPRAWTVPAVSTNYRYHKTWKFRNFNKKQINNFLTGSDNGTGKAGIYGWFDAKVNTWVNENRPPSSHDVDCDANLNDDGFYDGQVTVDARWAVGTAGQNGAVETILSSFEWKYFHFDPAADKNYTIGPVSEWDGTWSACKYRMLRVIGRGKNLLAKFTRHTACMKAPSISYNPESGVWTFEVQIGFEGIYTVNVNDFLVATWRHEVDSAGGFDAPNTSQISVPSLPTGTEF